MTSHGAEIESFENVQHFQGGNTLTVWRKLEHIVTAIVYRDWLNPCRVMLLEIGFPQKTPVSLHKRVDFIGDLTFVKTIASSLADQSQRRCQRWIFEDVAF